MLRYTLLLAYRCFQRFKSTLFINLIGLSMSLAEALFIYLWVNYKLAVDKFHKKGSRLFQLMHYMLSENGIKTAEATLSLLAKILSKKMHKKVFSVVIISVNCGFNFKIKFNRCF